MTDFHSIDLLCPVSGFMNLNLWNKNFDVCKAAVSETFYIHFSSTFLRLQSRCDWHLNLTTNNFFIRLKCSTSTFIAFLVTTGLRLLSVLHHFLPFSLPFGKSFSGAYISHSGRVKGEIKDNKLTSLRQIQKSQKFVEVQTRGERRLQEDSCPCKSLS